MPKLLFFAGTDTDVGKTYVASLAARHLHNRGVPVGVYKPVASGCRREGDQLIADDAMALWHAAGRVKTIHDVCPQRYIAPLAPPEAAAAEGKSVNADLLARGLDAWRDDFDVVIVEGAGGLFSPLAEGVLNIDLAKQIDATLVIVAANRLGAIHQTLSTCAAAQHHGVPPRAILLCDPTGDGGDSVASNAAQIERYCDVPVIGSIDHGGGVQQVAGIERLVR